MRTLMLSCKEIVLAISDSDINNLKTRIKIRAHLMMCQHCSNYYQQLKFIKRGFKKMYESFDQEKNNDELRMLEANITAKLKK